MYHWKCKISTCHEFHALAERILICTATELIGAYHTIGAFEDNITEKRIIFVVLKVVWPCRLLCDKFFSKICTIQTPIADQQRRFIRHTIKLKG